jgi:Zn-dependent peptidase ImmA (M78 family)
MDIPASIQVGQLTYKIILDNNLWANHEQYGMANKRDQTIRIDSRLKPEQRALIFIHEVLHLALEQSGLVYRLEQKQKIEEEDIVRSLESVIYQVVKQLVGEEEENDK